MSDEGRNTQAEEARIRHRMEKRYQEWQGFAIHGVVYLLVNLILWLLWAAINYVPAARDLFMNALSIDLDTMRVLSLPIPLVVMLLWGVGLAAHYVHYYIEYGPGADRHEAAIQREIERYKEHIAAYEKPKNDNRLELTDDGEIEEIFEDGSSGSRGRR